MTELADLAGEEFVELTTFRRTGTPVSVPVWVAAADDPAGGLVVTTMARSGKVKRLRHDPAVTLRPCGRHGELAPDAPTVVAVAEIIEEPDAVRAHRATIREKYGERMKRTPADDGRPADDEPARAILRITPA